jgi:hypothetical protein
MAIDDYHRMKLFSHIFNEVDMKISLVSMPILVHRSVVLDGGLTVMGELAHHHSVPSILWSIIMTSHKDLISISSRCRFPTGHSIPSFDAGVNAGQHGVGLGR